MRKMLLSSARLSSLITSQKPPTLVASLLVVAILLGACTTSSRSGTDEGSGEVDFLRAHSIDSGGGHFAIVSGVVEVDVQKGCVWLGESDGSRYPVVWPLGTTAQLDPFEISFADGQVARPGDQVEGGGGFLDSALTIEGITPLSPDCAQGSREVAVFNLASEIKVTPAG